MSESEEGTLEAEAELLWDVTLQAGFAMMKANYKERPAFAGSEVMVPGVEPAERDLAVMLRNCLTHRFSAMLFHNTLIQQVHESYESKLRAKGPGNPDYQMLYSAASHHQALFDSVVFHAISMFDYLGNAVWFAFHGKNFVKKKWKNLERAARDAEWESNATRREPRIADSRTGVEVLRVHRSFVSKLADYRAAIFHYRIDSGTTSVTDQFKVIDPPSGQAEWTPRLNVALPDDYARQIARLLGTDQDPSELSILDGANTLARRSARAVRAVLEAMIRDAE